MVLKAFTETIPFDAANLPTELRPVVERCLKREAGERFTDARQAGDAYRDAAREAARRLMQVEEAHAEHERVERTKRAIVLYAGIGQIITLVWLVPLFFACIDLLNWRPPPRMATLDVRPLLHPRLRWL